jgi:Tfp pilus assembly protein PilF
MLRQAVLMTVLMALPLGARAQEEAGHEPLTPDAVAEPALAPEPSPAGAAELASAAIDRGLSAYWRHNWSAAQAEFQAALDADPNSAAAAFYLGYAFYKEAERRPFHPDKHHPGKQRAQEMFARAFELDPTFAPTFQRSGR